MSTLSRASGRPDWSRRDKAADPLLRTANGLTLEPPADDNIIADQVRTTGSYEPEILAAMQLFLMPGDTFVDVGANFGWHTTHAARFVGASGRVHAFEPSPEVADILAGNCERNGLSNVAIHRIALGARQGTAMLAMNSANPGGAKIANYGTVPVSVFALDRVIDGEKPAMMKIDVEGYELEVLRGAHRTLQHEPVLVVEYNRGPHRNRLYRFLTERGYSLYIVSERLAFNWMRMPFVASDFENVVAVPKRLRHVVSPATALDYPHILVWLRYGPPRSIALWFLHLFGLKRRPRPPAPSAPAPGVGLHKIGGGDVNQRDLVAVGEGEHGVRPDLR